MPCKQENPEAIGTDSDLDIVRSVLAGDIARFELLIRRYNNRLYRVAKGLIYDQDEAMDVVQESWVAAYYSLDTFRGPQGFGAWVSRITHNNALMRLRKQSRLEYQEEEELEKVVNEKESTVGPADELSQQQLSITLEQAVNSLPIRYRSVFVLRAIQLLNTRETAESLGLKESAVKQRYLRAKSMLQEKLLTQIEGSGVTIWEFAGERCDQIVAGVFASIDRR